jgi:hypothetical protein
MVLSIGFEAFVQQLIVYPSRNVVSVSEPAVLRTSWIDSTAREGRRGLNRAHQVLKISDQVFPARLLRPPILASE